MQWALSRDEGHRLCMMTANASESFNGVLKGARALPIQALIVRIFFRLVKFFRKRWEAEQWNTSLTPKNETNLRYCKDMTRGYSKQRFSYAEWEVLTREGYTCTVTLREGEPYCTCNLPQLQKLSCAHIIVSCSKESDCANISTYSLCASWYSVNNYHKSSAPIFHLVLNRRFWPEYTVGQMIFPLDVRRPPGRPPSVRIRGIMNEKREGHRRNRCSNCKKLGHNKVRCHNPQEPSSSIGLVCVWFSYIY